MTTFKKILVGLDPEDTNDVVFQKAVMLAKSTHANLVLLSVLIPAENWSAYQERYRKYQDRERDRLSNFVEQAKVAGVDAELVQVSGSPGWAICENAQIYNADLLMVGSHGRMGLSEMLLGSVSNYVMHHASCSVLVVHE